MRKMNKRGNIFLGAVIGFMIFAFGVLFMPFIADDISTARGDLDCSNPNIYSGTKLVCFSTYVLMPYFIWFFVSAGIGYLAGKE